MSRAVSRRTALRGSLAASLGLVAGVVPTQAAPTLSANDRRLVELADAYETLERRCDEHTAAHRDDPTNSADAEFNDLTEGLSLIEAEVAETQADTLVGVIAKARMFQVPTARAWQGSPRLSPERLGPLRMPDASSCSSRCRTGRRRTTRATC